MKKINGKKVTRKSSCMEAWKNLVHVYKEFSKTPTGRRILKLIFCLLKTLRKIGFKHFFKYLIVPFIKILFDRIFD